MKNVLSLALCAALLFSGGLADAANTATARNGWSIGLPGGNGPVIPISASIDTVNTDLTIYTPAAGNMACIVGELTSEGTATNVIYTSGATQYVTLELSSNQGMLIPVSERPVFCTQPGEALKVQASAAITSILFYIYETNRINLK